MFITFHNQKIIIKNIITVESHNGNMLLLLQSCLTLCDPTDSSPPGSPVPGILQARTLEWVAISFSSAGKWKVKSLSHVQLLATPWTAAHQAPPSMGFPRQEYWSGVLWHMYTRGWFMSMYGKNRHNIATSLQLK